MNGIFGAGPADQDYEKELEDSAKYWEPTFSERAIARQWDLPAPQTQALVPVAAQPPRPVMAVRSAPMPSASSKGMMPIAQQQPGKPLAKAPATAGLAIPKWLPWTLALAAVGALVYVVAKKPAAPKLETPTI